MILGELIRAHEMLTDYGIQCYRNIYKGKIRKYEVLLWKDKKKWHCLVHIASLLKHQSILYAMKQVSKGEGE